jgi:Ran GTPase-activating protein (RanGAP) involved in mRNA processing and transport
MVLIDGHDSGWLKKFHTAAAAVCSNSEDLTGREAVTKPSAVSGSSDKTIEMEEQKRKLVFMHLNLGHVPWDQLPMRHRNSTEISRSYRFLAIEVVDCSGLEHGLPFIFQLPMRHLYISHKGFLTEKLSRIISNGLGDSALTLQRLQVSGVLFTTTTMKRFMNGLAAASALQELNLSYTNFLGEHSDDDSLLDIAAMVPASTSSPTVEVLAHGLSKSQLFCLKLNKCHLTDEGVSILVRRGFCHNSNLQELYLGGNKIGREGLSALAEYLAHPSSSSLVTLGLSNSMEADDSESESGKDSHKIVKLYPALAANKSLRVLHLASNDLTDEDMIPLCAAIAESNVSMLDLKSNRITSDGVRLLAEHLPPKLEQLWLLGNSVGVTGALAMRDALAKNHVNLIDLRIPKYESFMLMPELEAIENDCHYYLLLNRGGRRILLDEEKDNEYHKGKTCSQAFPQRGPKVPQSLWPTVLERVNRVDLVIPWCRAATYKSVDHNRAQVIFYFLKNSTLFEQRHGW